MQELDFESLISPVTRDSFYRNYLSRTLLHTAGHPQRFSSLFSWPLLNDILAHNHFTSARLGLFKHGQQIPHSLFATVDNSSQLALRPADLTAHMRGGATLIINAIDELYEPLTQLARRLERDLYARIKITLHAGFNITRFPFEWRSDDVFLFQIVGSSKWTVLGQTYGFPPSERNLQTMSLPQEEPKWEGELSTGDVLYIPRGWWFTNGQGHKPTIYTTATFRNPTGVELLQWLAHDLKHEECVKTDLPLFASEDTQRDYLEDLAGAIATAFSNPALIERFVTQLHNEARPRPSFSMPDIKFGATSYITLLAPRGLRPVPAADEDAVDVLIEGTKVRFHQAAKPLLDYLNEYSLISVAEFMETFAQAFGGERLEDFLKAMVNNGLISIHQESPDQCTLRSKAPAEKGSEC